jgi:hypothetical protein
MSIVHSSGAVADPCCAGSRGASFGTPCYYICVTLSVALAGALDQSTELATSYNLIPRCDSTNRKTAG